MRLQKYLADAGVASRRKCESLIGEGRVAVNGVKAELGASVNENDIVELDGKRVMPASLKVVYAFYKPKNVICSSAENEDRIKVTDYFKDIPLRLYTVGRLDYDSEGLIFVTNDGDFADKLTHPRYMKTKTYRVFCSGEVTKEETEALRNGVELDDGITAPAEVKIVKSYPSKSLIEITIREGRNRQVRRMLEKVGHTTLRLCRISIGNVKLGGLKPGERRILSAPEIDGLLG
ncbi:MAG: rRNA pseudouridine synthase [Clostridia bacterium]|nr:rRNA pseudouridine synthase [Clostridia bacterium]